MIGNVERFNQMFPRAASSTRNIAVSTRIGELVEKNYRPAYDALRNYPFNQPVSGLGSIRVVAYSRMLALMTSVLEVKTPGTLPENYPEKMRLLFRESGIKHIFEGGAHDCLFLRQIRAILGSDEVELTGFDLAPELMMTPILRAENINILAGDITRINEVQGKKADIILSRGVLSMADPSSAIDWQNLVLAHDWEGLTEGFIKMHGIASDMTSLLSDNPNAFVAMMGVVDYLMLDEHRLSPFANILHWGEVFSNVTGVDAIESDVVKEVLRFAPNCAVWTFADDSPQRKAINKQRLLIAKSEIVTVRHEVPGQISTATHIARSIASELYRQDGDPDIKYAFLKVEDFTHVVCENIREVINTQIMAATESDTAQVDQWLDEFREILKKLDEIKNIPFPDDVKMKEKQASYIKSIETTQRIIEDFISAVEGWPLIRKVEDVNLGKLLQVCIEDQVYNFKWKYYKNSFSPKVKISLADDLLVRGDERRLRRVFMNITKNAFEAMLERENMLFLSVRQEGEFYLIEIEDRGVGIKKDDLKRIFDPFVATKKEIGGTGIGLALCRKIIKEHGGTISARNNENGPGATFTVKLPVGKGELEI